MAGHCPTALVAPAGTKHTIVGCGSSNIVGPDEEGLYDCLDCGIWWNPLGEVRMVVRKCVDVDDLNFGGWDLFAVTGDARTMCLAEVGTFDRVLELLNGGRSLAPFAALLVQELFPTTKETSND
jgi:hypothetical protein